MAVADPSPDVSLDALRRRAPDAVTALVRLHHRALRGFVAMLCPDLDAVDDLAQEVFLRALQRLDRLHDLEGFDRYLRGIARNVVREHVRGRFRSYERYAAFVERVSGSEPTAAEDPGAIDALRRCVEKLPPRSRRLLDLRYAEERDAEDIGRDLDLAAGHVRVLLLRIRETLFKCLRGGAAAEARG